MVDSEQAVGDINAPLHHLEQQDVWRFPANVTDEQCHLMVPVMEAWVVADPDALSAYYGQGFRAGSLPRAEDIERSEKERLLNALETATGHTQKRRYHKTRHAPDLLERIDTATVRRHALSCDRLFATLSRIISASR